MKTKVLILINLLPACLCAQEVDWNSIQWAGVEAKVISVPVKKWIAPVGAGLVAVGGLAAVTWPGKAVVPDPPINVTPVPECTRAFSFNSQPAICTSPTGSAEVVSTEIEPMVVEWPDGFIGALHEGLVSGTYPVIIRDGECVYELSVEVPAQFLELTIGLVNASNPSSPTANDGSLSATVIPALHGPFQFVLNGEELPASVDGELQVEGLVAGTYLVQVTDARGCTGQAEVELVYEGNCDITLVNTVTPAFCLSPSGSASIESSDGIVFTATWPDGTQSASHTGLAPGDYTVTVEFEECSVLWVVTIPSNNVPIPLDVLEIHYPSDPLTSDGAFSVAIAGPALAPFQFFLNGFLFPPIADPVFFAENLSAGMYEVIVIDDLGCQGQVWIDLNLTNPEALRALRKTAKERGLKRFQWVFTPIWWRQGPDLSTRK